MDAFDADVLIYAAAGRAYPFGMRLWHLLHDGSGGIGSLILLPEVLAKPMREGSTEVITNLTALLSRLELHPVDPVTAELATSFAAAYRLHAADAVHLATAVVVGADRFVTNNRKDFTTTITEVDITYPEALAG